VEGAKVRGKRREQNGSAVEAVCAVAKVNFELDLVPRWWYQFVIS
jgi:hypothetical protein